jgi:hypothetical protein
MMHVMRRYPALPTSAQSKAPLLSESKKHQIDESLWQLSVAQYTSDSFKGTETVYMATIDLKKYLKTKNFSAARHSLNFAESHINSLHRLIDSSSSSSSTVLFLRLYLELMHCFLDLQEKEKLIVSCHELLDYCKQKVAESKTYEAQRRFLSSFMLFSYFVFVVSSLDHFRQRIFHFLKITFVLQNNFFGIPLAFSILLFELQLFALRLLGTFYPSIKSKVTTIFLVLFL